MSYQITVLGGNLFQIALTELGDPLLWNRIAEASGTGPDPFLTLGVPTVLTIPDNPVSSGGVYNG